MKRLAFAVLALPIALLAQPELKFEKKVIKYDKVKAGEILSFNFLFTNSGTQPLIISEIKVGCPCTSFDYPKRPVLPSEKDTLKVTFDTNKKYGWQDRELEIIYNSPKSPEIIRFKGMVDNKK